MKPIRKLFPLLFALALFASCGNKKPPVWEAGKTYELVLLHSDDYLLGGGDGYAVLAKAGDPFNTSLLLSYVVIEYINSHAGPVVPAKDGRMEVIQVLH